MSSEVIFGSKVPVYSKEVVSNSYFAYIDGEITTSDDYRDLLFTLDAANEGDVVTLHINSIGGCLHTALQIRNALATTRAHTVAVCHGFIASAATIIALSCGEIHVNPMTTFLVHQPSYGVWDNTRNVRDQVDFLTKELTRLCYEVYEDFMTKEEIENMIESGLEVYMSDKEIVKRLKRRNRKQSKRIEKEVSKGFKEIEEIVEIELD